MEDVTVKAGLLMESVEAQRALAADTLERLQAHTAGLDAVVREEIRATLLEELSAVTDEGRRAAQQLRGLARAAGMRLALWSLGSAVLSGAVPLALGTWFLPTRAEVARLAAARDALEGELARLTHEGGRAQLRRCGTRQRLCVRIDRSAPAYGDGADFLVLKGY